MHRNGKTFEKIVWTLLFSFGIGGSVLARSIIDDEYSVCQNDKCKQLAELFRKSMNTSADPCVDFYEYACGGWGENLQIPSDEVEWNIDAMVQKDISLMKKHILSEQIKPDDTVPLQLEKRFYQSCMDQDSIEKAGVEPLLKIINDIGGWPLMMRSDQWDSRKYSWQSVQSYYANLTGTFELFSIDVEVDLTNTTKNMLYLDQPEGIIISDWKPKIDDAYVLFSKYLDSIRHVLKVLIEAQNQSLDDISPNADLSQMIQFGFKLITIQTGEQNRTDYRRFLNYMTISDLQKFYNKSLTHKFTTKIDWLKTLQNYFNDANVTVDESTVIMVQEPDYLVKLAELLDETPHRTIVNYIHWMNILRLAPFTPKIITDKIFENFFMPHPPNKQPKRWQICGTIELVETGISYEFVKRNVTDSMINVVEEITENVRQELANQIQESNWMDDDTKMKNVKKINAMKVQIAYPEWYNDLTLFNSYLNGLKVGDNLLENAINTRVLYKRNLLAKLHEPADPTSFSVEPTVSNAFYQPNTNSLTILAAELTVPIFHPSLPKAINYGSIGFTSGHEFSHGFDSSGIMFTKDGSLSPWWPKNMTDIYDKKLKCLIDQFNNYSTDGNLTQTENTADFSGLLIAFNAYKKAVQNEHEQKLPGLTQLTPEQLYFLSFASIFCTIPIEEREDDVHSSPPIRVNGAVANSDDFNKAFHCVNERTKCSLWK